MKDTHQLLVYADDVTFLGETKHSIKKNTEALIAAKIGLHVNAQISKYILCFKKRMQDSITT